MNEKRILVVDDEVDVLKIYSDILKKAGYAVTSANSAEEALKILQKNNILAMFLDLNMPGMSGIELCKKIRKDKPISCIIAITGYTSIFELAECREAGFDDYFPKPIRIEMLIKAADDAFGKIERWKKW